MSVVTAHHNLRCSVQTEAPATWRDCPERLQVSVNMGGRPTILAFSGGREREQSDRSFVRSFVRCSGGLGGA
jgi:hypothetical protein